jgi:hypothetical protein
MRLIRKIIYKKVKYAYQEMPHSEDTDSPHSQEEERKRESMVYKITNFN